jgi:hypothetical protein
MADHSTDKVDIATERSRILHAFWLSIIGLALAAILTVFLVWFTKVKFEKSAEVVAIVGAYSRASLVLS